ncbi:hypothetical protein LZ198_14000 [Myxococcus sp. K15C18031901]|uniref:hypothetical protein n=1 Tax=Myxococcus dinghuensis TaxID=2906761 RepID=UPI0020A72EBC|nr:hypothetical protein [Myxococcus dinghuensis]MCP3099984.1 hypothetical protein [Myxococcus dinghuensis]
MKRCLNGLGLVALLGLLLAPAAHADVVDDVWRGTNMRLNAARIRVRGNDYATGYWLLRKSANTLNLHVPARDFGINSNLTLNMYGSRSGNVITWTFDDTLPQPYYLGDANSVTRVRGTLKAFARQVRGADDPYCERAACPHNVELVLTSGSQVWIDGYTDIVFKFNWTEAVDMRQFIAYAGVPRPRLASMRVLTSTNRCPSADATELSGEVTLSTPAPTGGTLVELLSVDSTVGVMNVRVPEAQRVARFPIRLPGGWSGPTVIQASSGGAVQTLKVGLMKCIVNPVRFTSWRLLPLTVIPRFILNGGAMVARQEGQESDTLFTSKMDAYQLNEVLAAERVDVKAINSGGDLFGTAYGPKGKGAFRLKSSAVKSGAEQWVEGFEALAGNAHGVPLVRWLDDPDHVYLVDEVGPLEQEGLKGLAKGVLRFNALGEVATTLETSKGARAVRILGKEPKVLVEQESEAIALNDVGMVLGTARIEKLLRPFLWTPKGDSRWLPLPEGFVSAQAVGLNDSGWVVGTATASDGKTQAAFITSPDGKTTVLLDKLAPEALTKAGYRFVEALAITNDLQVLARAVDAQGQRVHVVLVP